MPLRYHRVAGEIVLMSQESDAAKVVANERRVGQFLLACLEPRQHLVIQKAPQSFGVGGGGLVALFQLRGVAG